MSATETVGHGTKLYVDNGSGTFIEVTNMFNGPKGGGWSPRIIEARHHSKTNSVKKVTGTDISPVTFSIYFDSTDTGHLRLQTLASTAVEEDFRMVATDTGAQGFVFTAAVGFDFDTGEEAFNVVNVTLTPTDDVTVS